MMNFLRYQYIRQSLISVILLGLASCTHQGIRTEALAPPPFQQTIKGYMAELGQYMDDVYRFWDSASMHDKSLDRLEKMLEIHDQCLEIYTAYLDQHVVAEYRDQHAKFESYILRSRELTLKLKEAVQGMQEDQVERAFSALDQNRRDAHTAFGRAH